MPVNDDELLARADRWLERPYDYGETLPLVRDLRAALAAQPQPDMDVIRETYNAGYERGRSEAVAGSATPTDGLRNSGEMTAHLKWYRSLAEKNDRWAPAGSATPTGDDDE